MYKQNHRKAESKTHEPMEGMWEDREREMDMRILLEKGCCGRIWMKICSNAENHINECAPLARLLCACAFGLVVLCNMVHVCGAGSNCSSVGWHSGRVHRNICVCIANCNVVNYHTLTRQQSVWIVKPKKRYTHAIWPRRVIVTTTTTTIKNEMENERNWIL